MKHHINCLHCAFDLASAAIPEGWYGPTLDVSYEAGWTAEVWPPISDDNPDGDPISASGASPHAALLLLADVIRKRTVPSLRIPSVADSGGAA